MKIDIERIRIDEATRIRKEVGNLEPLQQSISQVGLINPILIDEQDNLVAGFRRLTACRKLGWQEIEVKVVAMAGDELQMLETEVAENLYRKDFTPDEILATQKRREEIIESRRKKGWFERFWRWLKNLFGGQTTPSTPAASQNSSKPSPAQAPKSPPPVGSDSSPAEPDEGGAERKTPEQESPEPPETRRTRNRTGDAPLAGEITEKDGVRHIKWR